MLCCISSSTVRRGALSVSVFMIFSRQCLHVRVGFRSYCKPFGGPPTLSGPLTLDLAPYTLDLAPCELFCDGLRGTLFHLVMLKPLFLDRPIMRCLWLWPQLLSLLLALKLERDVRHREAQAATGTVRVRATAAPVQSTRLHGTRLPSAPCTAGLLPLIPALDRG